MVGTVLSSNPAYDSETAKVSLNSHIRKIYDRRTWYGLMVRGQIQTTGFIQGGQATLTTNSKSVQGINTTWTPAIIGMQFRIGYNTPMYTITGLDQTAQVITLELPWGGVNYTGVGYIISQNYFSPGPNIKYLHTARNMMQAWRLHLDLNQQSLDTIDPWRMNTFQPCALAQMPPGANGQYMVELWPTPAIIQALPFIACVQPPNLVADTDSIATYIRTDILVKFGQADALVWRGPKQNPYYDMMESQRLRNEAEQELRVLESKDEDLYRQSLIFEYEQMRWAPDPWSFASGMGGANYAINHGIASGPGTGWGF